MDILSKKDKFAFFINLLNFFQIPLLTTFRWVHLFMVHVIEWVKRDTLKNSDPSNFQDKD